MVGLYGPLHHQVGRVDEIVRLGRRFVIGDLETDRAGEVGGRVGGPAHRRTGSSRPGGRVTWRRARAAIASTGSIGAGDRKIGRSRP